MLAFVQVVGILLLIGLLPDERDTTLRPSPFGDGFGQSCSNSRLVGVFSLASMKEIPLNNSLLFALIDDEDYSIVSQFNWRLHRDGWAATSSNIARRIPGQTGGHGSVGMHAVVMRLLGVDHRDHNKLNNQKYNLRPADKSQNGMNQLKQKRATSSVFKGVYWNKCGQYWCAYINLKGRPRLHLGCFDSERDAGLAYNTAALKYFGEFACLNPVDELKELRRRGFV